MGLIYLSASTWKAQRMTVSEKGERLHLVTASASTVGLVVLIMVSMCTDLGTKLWPSPGVEQRPSREPKRLKGVRSDPDPVCWFDCRGVAFSASFLHSSSNDGRKKPTLNVMKTVSESVYVHADTPISIGVYSPQTIIDHVNRII